ncbi:MAG: tRNA uridine-5-carboxymethylaminomethyl(34) synthesis GTPase MnmE [Pseudomonadota bacterium]
MTADTIAAVATPAGYGGVGIVRVSGPAAGEIGKAVCGRLPAPRHAEFSDFRQADGSLIDEGIVLYFNAPRSFTGEDVVEFQGHGGPVVMDLLLSRMVELGARTARAGEFSERAFLNGKMDLAQAEAVADLIDAASHEAARSAARSLHGDFSRRIQELLAELKRLRIFVEAAIDFPDEEVEFLEQGKVSEHIQTIQTSLEKVRASARLGMLLREGMHVVIAGRPNAGKSSLLNALAGRDAAIVTEIPGTTRDVLREHIQIDGMPLHVIDTAGLRSALDAVEEEGIRRARDEIAGADIILWVYDDRENGFAADIENAGLPGAVPVVALRNKIDLTGARPGVTRCENFDVIGLSIRNGDGLEDLRTYLKERMGYRGTEAGAFTARRRHLDAIERTAGHLEQAAEALRGGGSGELVAEDLRLAQQALGEITGAFTSDDLLGEIFSSFCIGK